MKRKTWLIPVAAGLLGISLTACGLFGSSSQTSSSSSSPASSGSSSSSSSASQSAGQSSSQPVSSAPESTSSSQSASQPESSSAPASSAAQTVDWNGSYVMAEGSASQRSLTISDSSATGFTFSFYSRGIEYTGTASASGVNATYQDPSADYSLVFEINGSQISVADQGDFPGANVSWEGVYRLE